MTAGLWLYDERSAAFAGVERLDQHAEIAIRIRDELSAAGVQL